MKRVFTKEEAWLGGFYELALEFAQGNNENLDKALQLLWDDPRLEGCYVDRSKEPHEQARIAPSWEALEKHGHLHGILHMDNRLVACGCCAIKEEDGPVWIVFYVPTGSQECTFSDLGEFQVKSREWREPLEIVLAQLGEKVFDQTPFSLGLIGYEVSGEAYSKELKKTGIPSQRLFGYLWPKQGKLTHYATNQWSPPQMAAS